MPFHFARFVHVVNTEAGAIIFHDVVIGKISRLLSEAQIIGAAARRAFCFLNTSSLVP